MHTTRVIRLLLTIACFTLCACINSTNSEHVNPGNTANETMRKATPETNIDSSHKEPVIADMRAKLASTFQAHLTDDTFYYDDDRYRYWWGYTYCPYFINIGQLFQRGQIHALVFYADDSGCRLSVYLKKNGKMVEIFEDEALLSGPELQDWNNDGVKDIYFDNGGVTDPGMDIYLWLTDKNGRSIHPVKAFEDLRFPRLDTITHHVTTNNMNNYGFQFADFIFKNYKLVTYETFGISFVGTDTDSLVNFSIQPPHQTAKSFRCSRQRAYDLAPERFKDDVINIIGSVGIVE